MKDQDNQDFQRDDYCFACGAQNPGGLRLTPEVEDGQATMRWIPPSHYQGFAGILHGGIISTLLDETMAHAALNLVGRAATAELSLQFLKPVRTGQELQVRAEVRERKRRILLVSAELTQDGEVRARGQGKFVLLASEPRP